ncbi:MAG: protein-L-isoaspartate(D-aspartate) O-methyltransferase [Candidatus Altiarchaeota archaeon]
MDFEDQRRELVGRLVSAGYVEGEDVIKAMLAVPREEFLPGDRRSKAYIDSPLPIGFGQTISAPHMVAIMSSKLKPPLNPADAVKILEIGTGSGYQAAVLAELYPKAMIVSIERVAELVPFARDNLGRCGYEKVEVVGGDGTLGHPESAPYDIIIVTAGSPKIPDSLLDQLAEGGRLLIPVGSQFHQELVAVDRVGGNLRESHLGGCVFVPLVGEEGWGD